MMAGWFGNFDYISDDLLNLLDLPLEDVEEDQGDGQLEPPPWDVMHITDCLNAQVDAPEFKNFGTILHEDSSLTKPLLKDALPITVKSGDASDGKNLQVFQTTSPVSVLESSSTPSAGKSATLDPKVTFVKRPRTKHPRTKRRHQESLKLTVDMSYKSAAKKYCNESDMIEEPKDLSWGHLHKTCFQTRQEEKNISPIFNTSFEMRNIVFQKPFATRKCTHCEATKTPQWREGPQGPKTLCNACGVRYRTGRLFPEYRPAGSPTYVHSLHSNSHKKVLELRHKAKLCETPLTRRNFNG